ncbi:hypothetical protein [Solitalea canadensis]|uniref:Uncharacterized protein n=1 Tax=Solitalea canadensis (strain ATCC 29591 / DSM 3403 / JCM 21819 / LMG 8368 / NBRC 15130 / NCIMB 12057 / USAM 9D) TaxID=929556 RepID=H8KQ86_SOLCM|nr:hypothetical protein [Solitalea canadensis]AFD06381.1 hypothetical protein Solca_1292 [Solitalea canadensis DSM 3403]
MMDQRKPSKNKLFQWVFSITLLLSLFTFQGFAVGSSSVSSTGTTTELIVAPNPQLKRTLSFKSAYYSYWSKNSFTLTNRKVQLMNLFSFNNLVKVQHASFKNLIIETNKIDLNHIKTIPQSFKNETEV